MEKTLNNDILTKANNIQCEIIGRPITPFQSDLNKAIHETAKQAANDVKLDNINSPIRIIPATTGAGKSTAVIGLIAAKYAADENYTAAFVCNTIKEADKVYHTLKEYIEEEDIYIHTSAHSSINHLKTLSNYGEDIANHAKTNRSLKSILSTKRIIVCTHQHWINEGLMGSDKGVRIYKGNTQRSNVFVDEMPSLCSIEEVRPSDILFLQELLECHNDWTEAYEVIKRVYARLSIAAKRTGAPYEAQSIFTADEYDKISTINLNTLQEDEDTQQIKSILQFLKNASEGKAFIARGHRNGETVSGHKQRIAFLSFNSNIHPHAGLIILDATAEYSALRDHPNVKLTNVPTVDYSRLRLTHIEAPKEYKDVARRGANSKTDADYLAWIKKTVSSNTDAGENVLVVAHKRFCKQLHGNKLPIGGRTIYVTHWGTGIGSNEWKDCSSVFLFAELHLPKLVYISTAAAVQDRAITATDISNNIVNRTGENHRLHLLKQLGCRGLVRNIDENGCAAEMKLFTSMDRGLLLRDYRKVFPNTRKPEFIQPEVCTHKTKGGQLEHFLLGYSGPDISICSEKVAKHLGFRVSELSTAFASAKCRNIVSLGWTLIKGERSVSKPILIYTDPFASGSIITEFSSPPKLVIKKGFYMDDFKVAA
jgi:hypothetical protein